MFHPVSTTTGESIITGTQVTSAGTLTLTVVITAAEWLL